MSAKDMEWIAKRIVNSGQYQDIVLDLLTDNIIDEIIVNENLMAPDLTKTSKAQILVEYLSLHKLKDRDDEISHRIIEIFIKNNLLEIAEYIHPKFTTLYTTRDSNCEFDEEIRTMPYIPSSASLPNIPGPIPLCPRVNLPDGSESYSEDLNKIGEGVFDIKVRPALTIFRDDRIYKNESTPRGYVFLLNISRFENDTHRERKGSLIDANNLDSLFTQMGYEVEQHHNLSMKEIKEELRKFTEHERLHSVDSCIAIVMSHGNSENTFVTADNRNISDRDFIEYFNNNNCPALMGKPKIFIFQFCRGSYPDVGVEPTGFLSCVSNDRRPPRELQTDGVAQGRTMPFSVPSFTDIVCIYATIGGYVAYLHPEEGSWLVQAICLTFMSHSHNTEWDALMKELSKLITQFFSDKGRKQVPELRQYAFEKHFYFNPRPLHEPLSLSPLSYALMESMSHSSISSMVSTPPPQRCQLPWESESRGSTPDPFASDVRFRHGSGTSMGSSDVRFRHGSGTSMGSTPREHGTFFRFKNDNNRSNYILDEVSLSNGEFPGEKQNMDVVDTIQGESANLNRFSGTADDYSQWRRAISNANGESSAKPSALKRQLSVPTDSEALKKVHGVKSYLQIHDLEEHVSALEPILLAIEKNKNKNKKKKEEIYCTSLDY